MRKLVKTNGLTVNAVAGNYVVFFGLDIAAQRRKGLLGFAFQRTDHTEDEVTWLRGMKSFAIAAADSWPGQNFSTFEQPVQGFQWADYSVKPGRKYTYAVHAMYGKPGKLVSKAVARVEIDTEPESGSESGSVHTAVFNRGSVATQEYARRFQNKKPSEVGPAAYKWLSRGLLETLLNFIGRARRGWTLHAAVYEFRWPEVLDALRAAEQRGAKVHIIFDDIRKKKSAPPGNAANRAAIANAGIGHLCTGRENGKIMHNKFFVLSKGKKAQAALTGSTNLTENGIFGHSNLIHIVEDTQVAEQFLGYWRLLHPDPSISGTSRKQTNPYRKQLTALLNIPPAVQGPISCVFSPRATADALNWYAQLADGAAAGLFITLAFGMHAKLQSVYGRRDNVLRMALLEKTGNPPTPKSNAAIQQIRNLPNTLVAIGNRIPTNQFDRWLAEMSRLNDKVHVHWVHTKYMLVDPLGDDPIVVTGSANFSEASSTDNDENMLVIRGDTRIADIYFVEYMRLYSHYAFRESVARHLAKQKQGKAEDWTPQHLAADDKWTQDHFNPKSSSGRMLRRLYFSGGSGTA